MKRAFAYKDEKSHKFWWIEYSGTDYAVNYGKWGATGKFEVKDEFDNEQECSKAAEKLIASKIKKGYVELPDFDYVSRIYIDDEEVGLHRMTSHPNFRMHFTEEFYYDCGDEEAPFGSDEGNDTLAYICEDIRKKGKLVFSDYPRFIIENYWELNYIPALDLSPETVKKLEEKCEMDMTQSDMVTYAVAFGQIKVTGKVNRELKLLALNAIHRLHMVWSEGKESEIGSRMIFDLESFKIYD